MKLPPTEQERLQAETNRLVEKLSEPYYLVKAGDVKLSPMPDWIPAIIELDDKSCVKRIGPGDYIVTVTEKYHIPPDSYAGRVVIALRMK